jgi:hypothetical protein
MLLFKDIVVKILFTIVCLSSIDNDDESMDAEHGFVRPLATNNTIVSDAIQGQSELRKSITDSFAGICPLQYFNTSKRCFPTFKTTNSLFELYNLTEQTRKANLTAERENFRLFGKITKLFFGLVFHLVSY